MLAMEIEFANSDLDRLYTDPSYDMNLAAGLVTAYRKKIQVVRAALDERDLYQMRSLHFEKLTGDRQHQRSIRLNDQFRLLLELIGEGRAKRVRIIGIVDYH